MTRLTRNPLLLAGLIGLAGFAVLAVVAPFLWGDAAASTAGSAYETVSAEHWFGTDALGRDVLARTLVATRLTLLMALAATTLAAGIGIFLGAAIWVAGPRIRELGQRIIDVLVSYPAVLFALFIAAILGPSAPTSVWAIGLATAPAFARLTTNLAASVSSRDFMATARLLGVRPWRLLRRHMLPNIAEPLLVLVSVAFTLSLKALAGLSFLQLGVQPPEFDWGRLLATGIRTIHVNPAPALGPALFIVLAGLASGLIGDGLAAAANPADSRPRGPLGRLRAASRAVPARLGNDTGNAHVEVSGLRVGLADGTPLVSNVSLDIKPGEIVGIVGESGSGKSLTAMAIAGLLPPELHADAGVLRVGELDLTGRPDPRELAGEIGIVYQDPSSSFNPTLRVGGQLSEVLTVHGRASGKEATARVIAALERVQVSLPETRVKQHPHELSGGMRQRAMIAGAMLTSPGLLIADEPTTALDVTVQAEVLRILKETNQRDGTAILMISHDIAVISSLCQRIAVMYAGRIVEELDVAALRAGHAQHPYTQALLAATPLVTDDEPPQPIPGRPPHPANLPDGCVFAPRCPLAREICRASVPEPVPTPGGAAACHALTWDDQPLPDTTSVEVGKP